MTEAYYSHDAFAEQQLLGIVLSEVTEGRSDLMHEAAEQISYKDFYIHKHKSIFEELVKLEGKPVDYVTLGTALTRHKSFSGEHPIGYLMDLAGSVPTVLTLQQHIQKVREESTRRKMVNLGNYLIKHASDPGATVIEALGNSEKYVMELSQGLTSARPSESIGEIAERRWNYLYQTRTDPNVLGIKTRFFRLNDMLGPIMPEYILLAARPSQGKTAFSTQIAEDFAEQGKGATGYVSIEMSKDALVDRSISGEAGIDQIKIRKRNLSEEEWDAGSEAVTKIVSMNIQITDDISTTDEIRSFARRIKREHGLAALIIDYLQLIGDKPERGQNNQNDVVSSISKKLKKLQKELGCPLIALSQLNRSTEKRADHRPILSDLRDSGSLEQDADQVWFIHRPEYYAADDKPGIAEIIVAKNRNGPVGMVELAFIKHLAKFDNLYFSSGGGQRAEYANKKRNGIK